MLSREKKEELSGFILESLQSRELLKQLIQKQNMTLLDLIGVYQEVKKEILIPLSIFIKTANPSQSLIKYLKEKENYSNKEIAVLLHKDQRTIWGVYHRSKKETKIDFFKTLFTEERYFLPLSIFKERTLTISEQIVFYLNTIYNLKTKQIASLLHKSPNSIAVILKRAREKR